MVSTASGQELDLHRADSLLRVLQSVNAPDDLKDIALCDSLDAYYRRNGNDCRRLQVLARKADIWDMNFMLDEALSAVLTGMEQFGPNCDSIVLVELLAVRANIAISMEQFEKADSICKVGLDWWSPDHGDHRFKYALMNNQAYCSFYTDDLDEGLDITRRIYREAVLSGDTAFAMLAVSNLGGIMAQLEQFDSAEHYLNIQLDWERENNDIRAIAQLYNNLAGISSDRGEYNRATALMDSALDLSLEYGELSSQTYLTKNLASIYADMGNFDSAYALLDRYAELKDSLLSRDKLQAVLSLEEQYQAERSAKELEQVKVALLDEELQNERVTRARNITLFVTLGIVLLAVGLWSRLRHIRRTSAVIEKAKERSDELLLNILPEKVANELKETGKAEARQFEEVTVLFTDFKSFTSISEKLPPADLVAEVDRLFKMFDKVMQHYGIEKIKTIGDAYMAAGGLHEPRTSTAKDVVLAALELQRNLTKENQEKKRLGQPYFEMRVGIHTGPVVAGVVGDNKFQYDIWGDTVNTANRMEGSCEVGQVNISEATYQLLKDEEELVFHPRGKVPVKGKGEVTMYFVEMAGVVG